MATPKGAVSPRRLSVTPELMADVRRRYEQTEEPLATMAADLGCSNETVRNIAKRENWTRYVPPPRDLTRAAKLRIQVEALAQAREQGAAQAAAQQSPLIPAQAGIQEQEDKADAVAPGSPLARGRTEEDVAVTETASEPPQVVETAQQLHRELHDLLADVRAERARMKREGYGKHELQEMSRVIASLSATLKSLRSMRRAEPQTGADNDYDDVPTDLDEFREALARRIEAFMEDRADEEDAFAVDDEAAPHV